MATEPIQWREPILFEIGDTLKFQRNLPDRPPSDGWSIVYTLTNGVTGALAAEFASAPDATNCFHTVSVADFGAGLAPGLYILNGQIACAAGGAYPNEKYQIYYGDLKLSPDLIDGEATGPVVSEMQQMRTILWSKILRLESYDLTETDVQRSRLVVEDKNKTWERYKFVLEFCQYEEKVKAQRNTGRQQNSIRPVFAGEW